MRYGRMFIDAVSWSQSINKATGFPGGVRRMRVGLPRALLFHQYGDCWTSFLETLGVEPVVTEATTNDTVIMGTIHSDNETCLPVKVFAGHLLDLKEKTDAILVPRVVSQHRGMKACPKYLGLPDMARSFDPSLPPVLAPVMDLGDRRGRWAREWYDLAGDLGANQDRASAAVRNMMDGLRYAAALQGARARRHPSREITVGVAGHLYNVYDPRASLGLLDRIRAMGAQAVTVEEVPRRQVPPSVEDASEENKVGFREQDSRLDPPLEPHRLGLRRHLRVFFRLRAGLHDRRADRGRARPREVGSPHEHHTR